MKEMERRLEWQGMMSGLRGHLFVRFAINENVSA
jgi:hypothetical protein